MKTVWRYKLTTKPLQMIEMPAGAEILRSSSSSLFALVDPANAKVPQPILVVRLGEPLPNADVVRAVGSMYTLSNSFVVLFVSEVSMADLKAFEKSTLALRAEALAKAQAAAKKALKSAPEEDEDEESDEDE